MPFCQLCEIEHKRLVDSHVIPRAFYEEFARSELKGISSDDFDKTYRKGIYGQFLCEDCEKSFYQYDNSVIQLIKGNEQVVKIRLEGGEEMGFDIYPNAHLLKRNLQEFALAVLWRAAASEREEFRDINLGAYLGKIGSCLQDGVFTNELLQKVNLFYIAFRHGSQEVNQAFIPYRAVKGSGNIFGNAHYHRFGFPYGEFLIRLGGDNMPRQGYYSFSNEMENYCGVIWASNLSEEYPNWFVLKTEKINSDVNSYIRILDESRRYQNSLRS